MADQSKVLRVIEILMKYGLDNETAEKVKQAGAQLDEQQFYDYVTGLIWNYKIPVIPRDLAQIKRILTI
jgi:hypothetical protein